ncbi:hypothetical protein DBR13_10915 [Aeromonas sp. HMWF015]|nr:hypothetical protein DBR13_10915 [Aeromonas sp. HMWF015]
MMKGILQIDYQPLQRHRQNHILINWLESPHDISNMPFIARLTDACVRKQTVQILVVQKGKNKKASRFEGLAFYVSK